MEMMRLWTATILPRQTFIINTTTLPHRLARISHSERNLLPEEQTFVIKIITTWLRTGHRLEMYGSIDSDCFKCDDDETVDHHFLCERRTAWKKEFKTELARNIWLTSTPQTTYDWHNDSDMSGTTTRPSSNDASCMQSSNRDRVELNLLRTFWWKRLWSTEKSLAKKN